MQPSTDGNRVDENPSTSTRDLAREVQVSKTKVWQTLREEGLYPFHVQRVQALQPDDFPARVRFCEWLVHQHDNNPDFLKCILVTDESTFTRNGVNNFRNTHVWSVENPHAVRRAHFQQTFSVNVWAGMVNGMLIGPFILPNRLDGMQYLDFLRNILPSWFACRDKRRKFLVACILYSNFQGQLSQQECLAELLSFFGNEAPHQSTISRSHGEFKRGRVSLSDDPRVGVPKTAVTQQNVDFVLKLISENRHVTYREIEASLRISKTSIQKILHEELGVRKLVSRWIPHLLTEEQKAARVNWSQKTLDRFNSGNSKNVYSMCCNPERRIILHQDNASSHAAQKTRQYLTKENEELLLRGQRFQSPKEAVDAFKNAVLDLRANDWYKCFEN
ncbi:unnamed protein product [Acanthoscelides obtectus]|uniref:Transposase n=1 Tax=Acanthoscelides obtectus TaxID=200917 RepID=A0A9P0P228_ACAOB|nr:unnamed protein product [Acanthoscelides obtectus]CAK1646727.1 hypothetical protein AOBTE_LOCUS14846 [Acanthoscelides obtectus]